MSQTNGLQRKKRMMQYVGTTHPSVLAVWACLIAVSCALPTIPMYGTGGTFSVSTILLPLSGIFFGPIGGLVAAAVGGFIGQILAPHTAFLGVITFLVPAMTGLTAGLLTKRKWIWVAIIIIILGVLWLTVPLGRAALYVPFFYYGLGLVVTIIAGIFGDKLLKGKAFWKMGLGVWLYSFPGLVAGAATGNFFGLFMFQIPADVLNFLAFVASFERAVFALVAAVIGVPLLTGLPRIGVYVGPAAELEENAEEAE